MHIHNYCTRCCSRNHLESRLSTDVSNRSWLRYTEHVEAALQGGATIKGQVMPHELVGKVDA